MRVGLCELKVKVMKVKVKVKVIYYSIDPSRDMRVVYIQW